MRMATATAVRSDGIWLRAPNYTVSALNANLVGRVAELKRALQSGVAACPDMNRDNFYDVELPNGWAYIHIRDEKHTVYLIAYHPNERPAFGPAHAITAQS